MRDLLVQHCTLGLEYFCQCLLEFNEISCSQLDGVIERDWVVKQLLLLPHSSHRSCNVLFQIGTFSSVFYIERTAFSELLQLRGKDLCCSVIFFSLYNSKLCKRLGAVHKRRRIFLAFLTPPPQAYPSHPKKFRCLLWTNKLPMGKKSLENAI